MLGQVPAVSYIEGISCEKHHVKPGVWGTNICFDCGLPLAACVVKRTFKIKDSSWNPICNYEFIRWVKNPPEEVS